MTLHGLWRMLLATATALLLPFTRNAPPALCCAAAKVLWKRRCNRLKWAPSWNAVSPLRKSSRAKSCWNAIRLTALMISGSPLPESSALRREGYEYEFPCEVPVGQPLTLRLETRLQETALSVNGQPARPATGKFIHNGTVRCEGIKNASFHLPAARIGSQSNAVRAKIEWMRIGKVPGNRGKKGLA